MSKPMPIPRLQPFTQAYVYTCTVLRVVDGDTVDFQVDEGFRRNATERMRLARINAWEKRGAERAKGIAAWKRLQELLPVGTKVLVETGEDDDVFGRWIADIQAEDGTNINDLLVTEGHARYQAY